MCVMLAVSAVAPKITDCWVRGKKSAVRLCKNSMDLQLFLSGSGGLLMIFFSNELVRIAFGKSYVESPIFAKYIVSRSTSYGSFCS